MLTLQKPRLRRLRRTVRSPLIRWRAKGIPLRPRPPREPKADHREVLAKPCMRRATTSRRRAQIEATRTRIGISQSAGR